MTTGNIVEFALKAFIVVMFGMNLAVILTWVDRRQGSMMQDRVGPNRAVAWLPRPLAQALMLVPAALVAGGIIFYFLKVPALPVERTNRAMFFSQLAIFALWATGVAIAGRVQRRGIDNSLDRFISSLGDPRRIFYAGLAAHLGTALVAALLKGTPEGRQLREIGYGAGPAVLAAAVLAGAVYAAYSIRKQERVGLRLAGLLHPAADGLKTIWKEDFIPPNADRFLHSVAPILSFFPVLVVLAVVPFGDTLCFAVKAGHTDYSQLLRAVPPGGVCVEGAVKLQVVDLNVGILYFFALAGTGIVGAALAGWASDNKFSLLGGLRAASQMVSYEVTLGLTVIGALMIYGTVRLDEMVRWQAENAWGIFVQPLAFFLFFTAAVAESKRIPFDLPEGESEIVAGYYTEYSGMKFAMFFFSEYVAVVTASALMVTLFLGGWHLPFVYRDGIHVAFGGTSYLDVPLTQLSAILIGVLAFVGKVIALCWVQLSIRWTLPRFRYDQLMKLGWRMLLPASLVNVLATGLLMLAVASAGAVVHQSLATAAELTMVVVAGTGLALLVWFVAFVLRPVHKRRLIVSTSAKYAEAQGGTHTARMGA